MKSYGQACPVAHALDVLGERWALLVLRDLRLGAKRFSDLAAGLPGIAPTVLTQRLRDLVAQGVVERRTLPPPSAAGVYALTERGRELEPVFRALASWGMGGRLDGVLPADPAVLGLRRSFRPDPAPWSATVELRIGRETYTARIQDGALAGIERGASERPDAVVTGPPEALKSGNGLEVTGDHGVARRFLARVTP